MSLRLLVLLVLLSAAAGPAAAITREPRSESKSSHAAVRALSVRLPASSSHPDPLHCLALPGTATEPAWPVAFIPARLLSERREALPRPAPFRAGYPRGPPRAA